jgi:glutaconate CoA-transferase subunit B
MTIIAAGTTDSVTNSIVVAEVPGYGCTIDELMVVTMSHQFDNTTRSFNGAVSFIPVCAYLLARATHAPSLVWAASSIAVDPHPTQIPESTLSDMLWDGACALCNSPFDFWAWAQGGHYNTFAFRGAQIDRFGNVNNTVIGPYDKPKVRLPGGGGMADLSCMIPRIYLWSTTHNPRIFVDRLDFRSGIGWGDGGDHRERLGLPGGPLSCITNLCVFDFEPESKSMRVVSLHPGVTIGDVRTASGFDVLTVDGEIPVTPRPSEDYLRILRTSVDPTSQRRREFA